MTSPRNGLKRYFLSLVLEKRWRVPRDYNDLLRGPPRFFSNLSNPRCPKPGGETKCFWFVFK